jgi:hypothetical protein
MKLLGNLLGIGNLQIIGWRNIRKWILKKSIGRSIKKTYNMKPFNTYEDMEDDDYEPENIPSKKRNNELYNGLWESGIPTGPMGEIYLGDGMVIKPNGDIEKE